MTRSELSYIKCLIGSFKWFEKSTDVINKEQRRFNGENLWYESNNNSVVLKNIA